MFLAKNDFGPRSFGLRSFALLVLASVAACNAPGMGYRAQSTNPDLRLSGVIGAHRGEDPTQSCTEGCAITRTPDCERCRQLNSDRGSIVIDVNTTKTELQRLLIEFPNHAPTLYAAATVCYDAGEREVAMGHLDELLNRHTVHPEAGILRSRIAIEEGNLPAAKRVLTQQIQYTPDHAGLREGLSAAYFLAGDYSAALNELEIAERLGAPAWRVAFNRGLIAELAGNPRGAIEQYEISLAIRPEYRAAASRRNGLLATAGGEAF